MSKKITISIPDELHEKMEKWKENFNFSRVFQEAIREKIQRQEDFKERIVGDPKMEEVIERLSTEKRQTGADWFDWGKNDGLDWAKSSHYDEIQFVVNGQEDPKGVVYELSQNEAYFDDMLDDYNQEHGALAINNLPADWEKGFVAGVCDFWDEVADKV